MTNDYITVNAMQVVFRRLRNELKTFELFESTHEGYKAFAKKEDYDSFWRGYIIVPHNKEVDTYELFRISEGEKKLADVVQGGITYVKKWQHAGCLRNPYLPISAGKTNDLVIGFSCHAPEGVYYSLDTVRQRCYRLSKAVHGIIKGFDVDRLRTQREALSIAQRLERLHTLGRAKRKVLCQEIIEDIIAFENGGKK